MPNPSGTWWWWWWWWITNVVRLQSLLPIAFLNLPSLRLGIQNWDTGVRTEDKAVTFLSRRKPPGERLLPATVWKLYWILLPFLTTSRQLFILCGQDWTCRLFIRIICYTLRLCFITKSYFKFGEMILWHLSNWNWSTFFVIYFCFVKNVSALVMRCKNGVTRCWLRPERNCYSATALPNVTSYNFVQAANSRTHKMKTNAG